MVPDDYVSRRLATLGEVSKKGSKVNKLFHLLKKKELWFKAYQNIAPNKGATTPGPDGVTQDGFGEGRVENLIGLLEANIYRHKPARRTYIPKSGGKLRPLGIPAGDDKLVQEAVRIILESIYEPVFRDESHGFRPGRSCHTALKSIQRWTGTKWFVEFDIKGYFDNIDHGILMSILERKIDDKRFLNLVRNMLEAGYLDNWKFKRTYSGTPQGGVVSPILANIFLHELDVYASLFMEQYRKGKNRRDNPEHVKLMKRGSYLRGRIRILRQERGLGTEEEQQLLSEVKRLRAEMHKTPSAMTHDENYRRLTYCRYADDFLFGVAGPRTEAVEIQRAVEGFLAVQLKLEVARDKTGVNKASKGVRFLGYDLVTNQSNLSTKKTKVNGVYTRMRNIKGYVDLRAPHSKIREFCKKKRFGQLRNGGMSPRPELSSLSEVEIVLYYNAEIRGFSTYYCMASDVKVKLHLLSYIATYSCLATLAMKHKASITSIAKRMRKGTEFYWKVETAKGTKVYRLWQIKHLEKKKAFGPEVDKRPNPYLTSSRTELTRRLEGNKCEYCRKEGGYFEVHHIRKLRDLQKKIHLRPWEKAMVQRKRKTLILCSPCHDLLHSGKLPDSRHYSD